MLSSVEFTQAKKYLSKVDPVLGTVIKEIQDFTPPVPQKREPFEALIRAIAHQQLHGKAAETILGRFIEKAIAKRTRRSKLFPTALEIMALTDAEIRACGFSCPKILAIRDIATKAEQKLVPSRLALNKYTDDEIVDLLVPLRGVGRWTVEMFLIFTLGRIDVLPIDDFGVREGYKVLFKKKTQPTPKELKVIGEKWAPYRSIVALYLWRVADKAKETKKRVVNTKVKATKKTAKI
jgi:DNA-3-methyladenine glycosylase II